MKIREKLQLTICIVAIIIGFVFMSKNKSYETIETANISSNKYKVLVDVEESRLYLLQNDTLIKVYKCSGGKAETPSPIGTWKITSKAKWGEGFRRKIYGD